MVLKAIFQNHLRSSKEILLECNQKQNFTFDFIFCKNFHLQIHLYHQKCCLIYLNKEKIVFVPKGYLFRQSKYYKFWKYLTALGTRHFVHQLGHLRLFTHKIIFWKNQKRYFGLETYLERYSIQGRRIWSQKLKFSIRFIPHIYKHSFCNIVYP